MKLFNLCPIVFFAIIFCNVLCMPTASAQLSVGVEGGYNKNYLVTNNANRAFTNYQQLGGFTVGIPLQYKITDWFALAADPGLIKKNYSEQRSVFFAGVYQDNLNTYIQLPLMGHFMFGGQRLKGFLNAGIYGGYWLAGTVKGETPNILDIVDDVTASNSIYDFEHPYSYNEKYSFDSRKDNRFDAGWVGGLGIGYDITRHYQVFTEGRILYDFTDQQKNYMTNQVPRYNTTYGMNAGILIHLGNPKSAY
jgi:hypothetical protein